MNETETPPKKVAAQTHTLPSGATLHMSRPGFAAASNLRNALARALGAAPLRPDEMKVTLDTLKEEPSTGGALLQRALMAAASPEVEEAVFSVLGWARYQPADSSDILPVNRALFDHPVHGDAARADYYPICYRAVEVAVRPFLGALVSMYEDWKKNAARSPKSPSTSPKSDS